MTLNSSGPISLAGTTAGQSIEIENGGNGTTQISLNDTAVRTLAGVPSGAITMPTNFYGKSNRVSISYTFTTSTANASLNVTSIGGYVAGKSDITVTVNGGVYLWASTTGNYGLALSGGASGDTVTLVNNGYIMGCGGNGGSQPTAGLPVGTPGASGGPALSLGFATTINNTNGGAYIGGGGGGGGAGAGNNFKGSYILGGCGGGAAGGGTGGSLPSGYPAGGAGGGIGSSGGAGTITPSLPNTVSPAGGGAGGGGSTVSTSGAGGGRIFPGSGGAGGAITIAPVQSGGNGGSSNNAGGAGSNVSGNGSGGGGGGWGASGGGGGSGDGGAGASGGAGGKAVALNGNSVTWVSGDTSRVWGAVS